MAQGQGRGDRAGGAGACQGRTMTDGKLSPELRRRLIAMMRDREGSRPQHSSRAEMMVDAMPGLSEDDAEQLFQRMLDDAEPGTEQAVSKFVEEIKAARSTKP